MISIGRNCDIKDEPSSPQPHTFSLFVSKTHCQGIRFYVDVLDSFGIESVRNEKYGFSFLCLHAETMVPLHHLLNVCDLGIFVKKS
ncbi:hypothetical protein STEG23_032476, partial [Scotinomys teguina]